MTLNTCKMTYRLRSTIITNSLFIKHDIFWSFIMWRSTKANCLSGSVNKAHIRHWLACFIKYYLGWNSTCDNHSKELILTYLSPVHWNISTKHTVVCIDKKQSKLFSANFFESFTDLCNSWVLRLQAPTNVKEMTKQKMLQRGQNKQSTNLHIRTLYQTSSNDYICRLTQVVLLTCANWALLMLYKIFISTLTVLTSKHCMKIYIITQIIRIFCACFSFFSMLISNWNHFYSIPTRKITIRWYVGLVI